MTGRLTRVQVRRAPLRMRRIGSALLVYSESGEDSRALKSVERLAVWPGHTAVCLDVPADTAPKEFDRVADALAALPDTPVLVPTRAESGSTVEIGAWLAQRCGRTVLAYEGNPWVAAGGCLFLPPETGAGWVRMDPDRTPAPYSRRFPKPWWECAAVSESAELGEGYVVEPIPAGVWIHAGGYPETVTRHRSLLIGLPPDPRFPVVVAGFPGSEPVAVARLARFWRSAPQELLPAMRLARFGPTDVPAERFGQALADAADAPVVVGAGVRAVLPDGRGGYGVWTLLPDGPMSWTPYVRDFGYVPSRWTPGVSTDPTPIDHRAPIEGLTEQGQGAYWYGGDTVLEVTQSGLWLRPAGERHDRAAIRSAPPEPGRAKIFVDLADPGSPAGRRMQAMARELIQALEPRTRAVARLMFVGASGVFSEPEPEAAPGPELELHTRAPVVQAAAVVGPVPDAEPTLEIAPALVAEPTVEFAPEPESVLEPAPLIEPEPPAEPSPEAEPAPLAEPEPEAEPVSLSALQLVSSPTAGFDIPESRAFAAPTAPAPERAPEPTFEPVAGPEPERAPEPPAPEPVRPPVPAKAAAGPRVQPVPSAQAAAMPPAAGIGEERVWLRRNLSKQYDATASSVSRVLSKYPGLRAGGGNSDALTDLVAVSLYLDGKTRELDDAVRAGKVGPHVPLARCVASGLRRLPSFRGVARLRAELDESQWRWYGGRELVTEWSFCPVLTSGRVKLPGDVDVLIWSMTARRTTLVDPSLPEQAVFLPGTNFKRLRTGGAGREIYLRELAHTEVAADGTVNSREPLDELALTALETAAEAWRLDGPTVDLDAGLEDRFSSPPGLIGHALSARAGRAAPVGAQSSGATHQGEAA
ncbi:MAG TPA: hypothetical protein VGZ32_10435 [Actinocrinis sp.]|jgi:hypothetical protein|uniref:hypothetical protein n=1 Tax=Actinocrinis sp. TaxID=1920516 RepID=UPI002DDDB8B8|nr:hypothetical protein [Actinocrinis sp.]HEV3170748.1 hypothetical protein [Actinocrinis sp.]